VSHEILPSGEQELHVALGFPNTRVLAEANLGFRIVSLLLKGTPGISLDHFFVPDDGELRAGSKLRTAVGGRSLAAVDLVLLSISYEGDAAAIPGLLAAGGLPAFARERRSGHPLVVAGGALAMINPEPISPFCDLVLIGEGEALLRPLLARWARGRRGDREAQIAALAEWPAALAPALRRHRIWSRAKGGKLVARAQVALPDTSRWRVPGEPDRCPAAGDPRNADAPVEPVAWDAFTSVASGIHLPPEAPLGPAYLLELARGCPRRCRFCAASRIYTPLRGASADLLVEAARRETRPQETVGLLALSAGDHPQLEHLVRELAQVGARLTLSSLPADFASCAVAEQLVRSGARTLTIAPETGSDRLRAVCGKPLRNGSIVSTAEMLGRAGLRRLRTYFIIGLPFEEEEDIGAIGELLAAMRRRLPGTCSLTATVNAFVPKPRTPFQWAAMAPVRLLKERARQLRSCVPSGVRLRIKSFREARLQALIARGDVAWGPRLAQMSLSGLPVSSVLRGSELSAASLTGAIDPQSELPWGYLIDAAESERLAGDWREAQMQAGH
jgi:radical SAM superfamily enzyme YgiQ (UPF0313 family)